MAIEHIHSLLVLAIGFSVAGLIASGYHLCTARALGFRVLTDQPRAPALAAVPLLVFAAPFLILRNTLRAARLDGGHAGYAALATIVAGGWSLMSGTALAAGLRELMLLMA